MKLTRSLAFLDTESTGLDPATDRIVELAVVILRVDGTTTERCQRINPGIPIPPEATAVHGITDADVADKPKFKQYALALKCLLEDCDLAGFNLISYDIPLLWEEFYRAGITWDLSGKQIVDCCAIFKKKEPRTLSAAVSLYCGYDHEGAHGALQDCIATAAVLEGQISHYPDLREMSIAQLAEFSRMEEQRRLDLAGKLLIDADGDAIYNIGNKKGTKVRDDDSFAVWMLGKDFTENTKAAIRAEFRRLDRERRYQGSATEVAS